ENARRRRGFGLLLAAGLQTVTRCRVRANAKHGQLRVTPARELPLDDSACSRADLASRCTQIAVAQGNPGRSVVARALSSTKLGVDACCLQPGSEGRAEQQEVHPESRFVPEG